MKALFTLMLVVALSLATSVTANTYTSITAQQADSLIKAHQAAGNLVILDVRQSDAFTAERIDKAINLDYFAMDFAQALAKLDKNKVYLVYCASGTRSNATMNKMRDLNFKTVFNMLGGLPAWKAAGLPTVKGAGSGVDTESLPAITVKLYPNPVTDLSVLEIEGDFDGEATVEFLNSIGSVVLRKKIPSNSLLTINGRNLSAGLYFYRVILSGKIVRSGKFQVGG
jgi:rhodanese-related sulfurtransferase